MRQYVARKCVIRCAGSLITSARGLVAFALTNDINSVANAVFVARCARSDEFVLLQRRGTCEDNCSGIQRCADISSRYQHWTGKRISFGGSNIAMFFAQFAPQRSSTRLDMHASNRCVYFMPASLMIKRISQKKLLASVNSRKFSPTDRKLCGE